MLVRNVPLNVIEETASSLGMVLYNLRPEGKGFAFVLRPKAYSERYRRVSNRNGRRRVWAICYHGHRAFMMDLFAKYPNAVIKTTMISYNGAEEFFAKHAAVGERNVGSLVNPVAYGESCDCNSLGNR